MPKLRLWKRCVWHFPPSFSLFLLVLEYSLFYSPIQSQYPNNPVPNPKKNNHLF
jgi:hypothetical protein